MRLLNIDIKEIIIVFELKVYLTLRPKSYIYICRYWDITPASLSNKLLKAPFLFSR